MSNTSKSKDNSDSLEIDINKEAQKPHMHPMICLFDFEVDAEKELDKLRFNYVTGSLGSKVIVCNSEYEQKLMSINHDYPHNLHEFDVVMLDMTNSKSESFDPRRHAVNNTDGSNDYGLLSEYPEHVFNQRPPTTERFSKEINELTIKKSIVIAFCGSEVRSEYKLARLSKQGVGAIGQKRYSDLKFYEGFPECKNKQGRKVVLSEEESVLSPLLNKHKDGMEYRSVFIHPCGFENGDYQEKSDFIPLLLNDRDEIISYSHCVNNSLVLVFPDIDDKASFIADLFKTYLPDMMPAIFPFHGQFGWLESGEYLLPGESELLKEKAIVEEQYIKDIDSFDKSVLQAKKKYKFLTDLISETGDTLVSAVEHYLKWLEFESVVNFDETNPNILEEDIQVDYGDRFLVIEIKGIGGTSTDKDCSQISKIRYRRSEERKKFDVFGLYIVNHQRYRPPKSRTNPPFSENQIKDAVHDKRGLLTAYDLYKAYFLIEEGFLQKDDIRESLFEIGLISLEPNNLTSIGVPTEFFKDRQIFIVNLDEDSLNVGDVLVVKNQDEYFKAKIESLQVNDNEVESCSSGEVGVRLDKKIKKKSELFIIQV